MLAFLKYIQNFLKLHQDKLITEFEFHNKVHLTQTF